MRKTPPAAKKTNPPGPSGKKARAAGGAAAAGGFVFQAAGTAIALVKLARGRPLGWLEGVANDVPTSVLAETGGAGDDLQVGLRDGAIVEIQIKRGVTVGPRLWEPLLRLAAAIEAATIQ